MRSEEWETPHSLFAALNAEFGFERDVCATTENAKCRRYFDREYDGLAHRWRGRCWMNPPYSRDIGKWVEKAYHSSCAGALVVALLPARTDTRWWHDWVMQAREIRLMRGRPWFSVNGTRPGRPPFPCVIAVFRGHSFGINPTVTAWPKAPPEPTTWDWR